MRRFTTASLLACSLLILAGQAQADVSSTATEAKDATVHAAKKTAEAAKEAASAVAATAKTVASGVAETAVDVYHKTKTATKKAVGVAAEKNRGSRRQSEGFRVF